MPPFPVLGVGRKCLSRCGENEGGILELQSVVSRVLFDEDLRNQMQPIFFSSRLESHFAVTSNHLKVDTFPPEDCWGCRHQALALSK